MAKKRMAKKRMAKEFSEGGCPYNLRSRVVSGGSKVVSGGSKSTRKAVSGGSKAVGLKAGGSKVGGSKIGGSEVVGSKAGGSKVGGSEVVGSKIGGSEVVDSKAGGSEVVGSKAGGSEDVVPANGSSPSREGSPDFSRNMPLYPYTPFRSFPLPEVADYSSDDSCEDPNVPKLSKERKERIYRIMDSWNPIKDVELTPEQYAAIAMPYAIKALRAYNKKLGRNYELVDAGVISPVFTGIGIIYHGNFKAKHKDKPNAPVKMFFAELVFAGRGQMTVDLCVPLGRVSALPDVRDNRGCDYCWPGAIYHPAGGGFRIGRTNL